MTTAVASCIKCLLLSLFRVALSQCFVFCITYVKTELTVSGFLKSFSSPLGKQNQQKLLLMVYDLTQECNTKKIFKKI